MNLAGLWRYRIGDYRHEAIGKGTMGLEPFRRLLNDARFAHAAFIAETPVDDPGDEERNVQVLLSLVQSS